MDDDQTFAQFQPHRDRFAAADAAYDLARREVDPFDREVAQQVESATAASL